MSDIVLSTRLQYPDMYHYAPSVQNVSLVDLVQNMQYTTTVQNLQKIQIGQMAPEVESVHTVHFVSILPSPQTLPDVQM